MRNSKFINALQHLSTRERSKFRELAYSPFFNKNKKVRRLIDHCLAYAPSFEGEELDKQSIFELLFGNEVYEELKINNVISDALKLLYLFLAQQSIMDQEYQWRNHQMNGILQHQMVRHLPGIERRLQSLQKKRVDNSHDYFYQQYHLEERLDKSMLMQQGREYSPHLQHANNALDQYYWCNKFRLACDMASRNKIIKAAYECHFAEQLITIYETQPEVLRAHPAIQLYYQALLMIQTEEEGHYRTLRRLLDQHSQVLPVEERYDLYDYAQNYCVKKINSGNTEYYEQILELYKKMLEHGLLLRNGYLTQWSYINILTAGLRLPDFEWTEWFIHTYKEQLKPEVRDNVFTYSLAALYFEQKDYHKALQSLQGVAFSDIFYHMSAKIIQLKSYYELEENEAFLSLMEASRKFLRRNRHLSDYQVQSNVNFLKLVGKLHKLNMNAGILKPAKLESALDQIQQSLEATKAVTNKGWLRQKVADLLE